MKLTFKQAGSPTLFNLPQFICGWPDFWPTITFNHLLDLPYYFLLRYSFWFLSRD